MMEVRFVKLIEINNLLSDGKCSDEHAVASRITGEAVVSKFRGGAKFSILTTDAATDKFVSEHTVASRIACESVVSERTATDFDTLNSSATTNFEVIPGGGKLVSEHTVTDGVAGESVVSQERSSGGAVNLVSGTARLNFACLAIRTGAFPCLTNGTLFPLACKVVGEHRSSVGRPGVLSSSGH